MSIPVYDLQGRGICLSEFLALLCRVKGERIVIDCDKDTQAALLEAIPSASGFGRPSKTERPRKLRIRGLATLVNFKPEFDTETPALKL
jgi:hypothetical protein